jgi:ankyrin repeat protein
MLTDRQRLSMAIGAALVAGDLDALKACFAGDPAFPNVQDPLTGTALLVLAIYRSPLETVRALLEMGANPNYEALDGFPSVYAALSTDRVDRHALIELLLDRGADMHARGVNDYTPLHYAVARRDARAIDILVARGADPSLTTGIDDYATPLEEAELQGNAEGAAMLRRALASPKRT